MVGADYVAIAALIGRHHWITSNQNQKGEVASEVIYFLPVKIVITPKVLTIG